MASAKRNKPGHAKHKGGLGGAVDIIIENMMMKYHTSDLTKSEVASLCEPYLPSEFVDKVIANALPNAVADRLRKSKLVDKYGNEVRRFGCYKVAFQTEDGGEKVFYCWKSWKHMTDDQQKQALQLQIGNAAKSVLAVKNLAAFVNNEVRKPAGKPPLRLRWDLLSGS